MAGPKLDGAGNVKIVTVHEAQVILQRCHGLVELMAMDVKGSRPITGGIAQLRRAATPLIGKLKGQFGMISDSVTAMLLAEKQILEKHSVDDQKKPAEAAAD